MKENLRLPFFSALNEIKGYDYIYFLKWFYNYGEFGKMLQKRFLGYAQIITIFHREDPSN